MATSVEDRMAYGLYVLPFIDGVEDRALPLLCSFSMSGLRPHSTEVYGFVVWISASLCLVLYLLWAYLPPSVLHALHITYYPDRYWAVAIPAYLSVLPLFLCFSYIALNLYRTTPLSDIGALEDGWTRYEIASTAAVSGAASGRSGGALMRPASVVPRYSVPDVSDMRADVVNAYMHRRRTERPMMSVR